MSTTSTTGKQHFVPKMHRRFASWLLLTMAMLAGSMQVAKAQYNTATVNGTIGTTEYGTHSDGNNQQSSATATWFMTWDNTNLYIGISGANVTEGAVMYLDKDPQTPINGGSNSNGSLAGSAIPEGANFTALQFRADLQVYFKDGNQYYKTADGSGGWSASSTIASASGSYSSNGLASGSGVREIAIPWSVIGGRPASFAWFGHIGYSGNGAYGSVPTANPGSAAGTIIGTTARWERYYIVNSTVDASSTKPFSRDSYVHNTGGNTTGFGAITVYDFTMNSSTFSITRTTGAGGAWTINGNMVVSNGTIDFGSSSNSASAGNVIINGGTLKLSSALNGDLNVAGNFTKTSGTFTCNSRAVAFNGTTKQMITSNDTLSINFLTVSNTTDSVVIAANVKVPTPGSSLTTVTFNDNTRTAIRSGSSLTVNSTAAVLGNVSFGGTGTRVNVLGTFKNAGTTTANTITGATATTFIIGSTGTYEQSFTTIAGTVIPTATWSNGSTLLFSGYTSGIPTATTFGSQTYHHITWNCPNQSATGPLVGALPTSINGNLSFLNTGGFELRIDTKGSTYSRTVGGDLILDGAAWVNMLNSGSGTGGSARITVNGNVSIGATTGSTAKLDMGNSSGANDSLLIKGNLSIANSGTIIRSNGSAVIAFTNGSGTQTLSSVSAGLNTNPVNLYVSSGSTLSLSSALNMGSLSTLSVNGTLNTNANALSIYGLAVNGGGVVNVNTSGSITQSGSGTVQIGNGTGTGTLNINDRTFTSATSGAFNIGSGGLVNLTTGSITMNTSATLTVQSGGVLDAGSANGTITGAGTFSMASGGVLRTANVNGIATSGTSSSVTTTTRNYYLSGTPSFTFYGSGVGQVTGNGLPAGANTIDSLTINNSNGVTLSVSPTVNTKLIFSAGKLNLNSNTLTLANAATITGNNTSRYAYGGTVTVKAVNATPKTFPIGTATSYAPLVVTGTATATDHSASVSGSLPCAASDATKSVGLAWTLNSSTQTPASVNFQWNSGDNGNAIALASAFEIGRYNAACPYTITQNVGTPSGSDPYNLTVSSGLSSGTNQYVLGNNFAVYLPIPVVTTTVTPTAIDNVSAQSGGTSVTGTNITAKGVVWGASANPTVGSNLGFTNDGNGAGDFSSSISGLSPETQYHVRAYATNSTGSGYGDNKSFFTLSNEPTAPATSFAANTISSSQIDLTWSVATFPGSGATANGYIILRRADATDPTTSGVVDGTAPASLSLPSGTTLVATITSGATTSYSNNSGLIGGTQYNYIIIPFTWNNANGGTYNYYLTSAPTSNATTSVGAPSITTTTVVTGITNIAAASGGSTLVDNGSAITNKGVVWATSTGPTVPSVNSTDEGTGTSNFTSTLSGLSPETLYYVRAYATNAGGTAYANEVTFRTLSNPATGQPGTFTATASAVQELTLNWTNATFPGSGATKGGYLVIYSTSTPTLGSANGTAPAAGTGTLVNITSTTLPALPASSTVISSLTGGSTYNFLLIPYTWDGTNAATYNYYTTGAPTVSGVPVVSPSVTTTSVTGVTNIAASSGGSSINAGFGNISAKGAVWAKSTTTTTPTLATKDGFTSDGSGTANYSSSLSSLDPQSLYYYRAYVTNEVATAYGTVSSFMSLSNPATAQPGSFTATPSASGQLTLSWTDATFPATGATKSGYLILYSTGTPSLVASPNGLTPANAKNVGTIIGIAEANAPAAPATSVAQGSLTAGTTYNFLIVPYTWDGSNTNTYHYYTTGAPTTSGVPIGTPTVTNVTVNTITNISAASGGTGVGAASGTISAKGVVWSKSATSTSPTLNTKDGFSSDGNGTANFTSTLSTLDPQTLYYYRAYATNDVTTGYGSSASFVTLSNPPTAQPGSFTASANAANSIKLDWTTATYPASGATRSGYLVLYSTGTPALVASPNGVAPASAISVGTRITVTDATLPAVPALTVTQASLTPGTLYNFLIVPYTWDGSNTNTYNYLTAGALTVSATAIGNPSVTTTTATVTGTTAASSGGSALNANSGTISAKGVVWGTSANPTIASNLGITSDGTGTANFTSSITGLSPQTQYNYRAYVTNDVSTQYGSNLTFYTWSTEPTAAASNLTAVTQSSTQINLSWTGATFYATVPTGWSASGYIILRRADGTNPDATGVTDGVAPASLSLPSGTTRVTTITSGATTSFNNISLTAGAAYNYIVIPFTWDGTNPGTYNYLTTGYPTASATTYATAPSAPTTLAFTGVTVNTITTGWSGTLTGFMVLRTSGATAPNTAPSNGTAYTQGGTLGNASIIYIGTGTSTGSQTGLADTTQYNYAVYAYNGSGATTSYSAALTGNVKTLAVSAPVAASVTPSATGFTASWNAPTAATGYQLDVFRAFTEGFENTMSLFTVTSGSATYFNGNTVPGDAPASSPYASTGTYGLGLTGSGSTTTLRITTSDINTNGLSSPKLTFRIAAVSPGGGNGMDAGDSITVAISPDGGATYYQTLKVNGSGNVTWAYSANNNASTAYDGDATPVTFGGGTAYGTATITGLPNTPNLRVRISMLCDFTAERWVIDSFAVTGNLAGYNSLSVSGTSQLVTGLSANTPYYYQVRAVAANSTSVNSNVISLLTLNDPAIAAYRSRQNGNYSDQNTWEYNSTGSTYANAIQAPGANNNVTITHTVTLDADATVGSGKTVTVNSPGTLVTGTKVLSGAGTFTLNSSGSIQIGSAAGITSSGATGNIQTTNRNFNQGANYTYNGTANQATGNGLPSTLTTGTLIINNSGAANDNIVTLTTTGTTVPTLTLAGGLFSAGNGGNLNITNGGNIYGNGGNMLSGTNGGTITFAGTGTISSLNSSTDVGLNNVTISNGVNFGSAITTTINGTFTINAGGFVNTNPPAYGNGSTLKYNTATTPYGRSLEWSSTSGKGYPFNVQVSNNTSLDVGNASTGTSLRMAGNLTVDNGSGFYMDWDVRDMTKEVTVLGNVVVNGNLSLSDQPGGDIVVYGNWNRTGGGFAPKGRAVFFNGTGNTVITTPSTATFDYLFVNKTGGAFVDISSNSFDLLVNNNLTLTAGSIKTGSRKVIIPSTSGVSRDGVTNVGWINGYLQKDAANGDNTFEVGSTNVYAPATVNMTGVSGVVQLTATAINGNPTSGSGIDQTKKSDHYWNITKTGAGSFTSYTAKFDFTNTTNTGTVGSYIVRKYDGTWATTTSSVSGNTITATGLNSFSDFEVGQALAAPTGTTPTDVTVCSTAATNLTFSSSSTSSPTPTVKWQRDAGSGFEDITGTMDGNVYTNFTSGTLNISNGAALNGYKYRAAYTNINGTGYSSQATLTVNPAATVSAGSPQTICAGSTVTLAGSFGGGASGAIWSGAGTFSPNISTLNAVYTPTAGEVTAGTATLTLTTNDPAGPCGSVASNVTITINPAATVNAGSPQTICAGSTVNLAGSFGGAATSATWSGGAGTFSPDANTLNAVYTPSAGEVTAGTVTLTLTTNDPAGPCGAVSSNVTITINPAATVSAGSPQTICAGSTVTLAGTIGGGASSATWSGGGGIFSPNNTTLNAVYTPSVSEVNAGTVTLTLTTDDPAGPCGAVNNTVTITINATPSANAGSNASICAGSSYTLSGATASNYSGLTWTTSGDGNFNNANALNPIYTPGATDISNGSVTLTLVATGNSPCGNSSPSNMTLTINAAGSWTGLGGDNNWNTAANWCGGVPTASSNVVIPAGVTINITSANAVANSVTVSNTATLNIQNTYDLSITAGGSLTNNGTFNMTSTGKVNFLGNGTLNGNASYTGLEINGTVTTNGIITVTGLLNITTGNQLVIAGSDVLTLNGTVSGAGTIKGSSTAAMVIGGTGALGTLNFESGFRELASLTVNRTSSGTATLGSDLLVGTLTLTNGVVNTGSNTLSIGTSVARTNGWVNGNLLKTVANGANSFEVGSAAVYAPTTVTMTGVSGTVNLTAKATLGTPTGGSGIGANTRSNHFWTITKTGAGTFTSYDALFDFTNTTNGGTTASYVVKKYDGTWASTTSSVTGTTITATSLTSFSDFEIGQLFNGLIVKLKVLLEGATLGNANPLIMRDNLRNSTFTGLRYIPNSDPYTQDANYTGRYTAVGDGLSSSYQTVLNPSTMFASNGNSSAVDWIFIELRDKNTPTTVLGTRSAIVRRDGTVVDIDGTTDIKFPSLTSDDYYVAIRHRNHLGVMTATPVASTTFNSASVVDFTTMTSAQLYNRTVSYDGLEMQKVTDGVTTLNAMWACDADGNKRIKYTSPNDDLSTVFNEVLTFGGNTGQTTNYNFALGYFKSDVDMNSKVKYTSPNDDPSYVFGAILGYLLNTGVVANYNFFIEQLP